MKTSDYKPHTPWYKRQRWSAWVIEGLIVLVAIFAVGQFINTPADTSSDMIAHLEATIDAQQLELSQRQTIDTSGLKAIAWNNVLNEEYDTAIAQYAIVLDISPYDAQAYHEQGIALARSGYHGLALRNYTQAIELVPPDTNPYHLMNIYYNRAVSYDALGNYAKALADFDSALAYISDYSYVYNQRGLTYANMGQHDLAIRDYNRAIDMLPQHPDAYYNRGVSYNAVGEYTDAIADFTLAIELDATNSDAFFNRGTNYQQLTHYESAINDYTRALELNPDDLVARYNRARVYYDTSQFELAIDDFSRVLRADSDNIDALYRRANSYIFTDQYNHAYTDYDNILAMSPQSVGAYLGRGIASDNLGFQVDAATDYLNWIQSIEVQRDVESINPNGDPMTLTMSQGQVYVVPFEAEQGQFLGVEIDSLTTRNDLVDPLVVVLDADGNPWLGDDDISHENWNVSLLENVILEDGLYTLVISHAGGGSYGEIAVALWLSGQYE